jgi:DNA polymerase-1
MVKAILDGMDLHCYTVSVMYSIPYEEVVAAKKAKEPTERQQWLVKLRTECKAVGFGIIYGAGAPTIASQIDSSKEEAQEKIDGYFDAFPGVLQYIEETHQNCRDHGYVTTIAGRRRRLELAIKSPAFLIRSHAEREAVNSTIQGSAADIVKFAMLCIEYDQSLNRLPVCMLNQIHDELVFEAPEGACEEASVKLRHYMEKPFNGKDPLIVPTPVDLKVVDRWSDAK